VSCNWVEKLEFGVVWTECGELVNTDGVVSVHVPVQCTCLFFAWHQHDSKYAKRPDVSRLPPHNFFPKTSHLLHFAKQTPRRGTGADLLLEDSRKLAVAPKPPPHVDQISFRARRACSAEPCVRPKNR
jgi:hypothetical protein